MNLLMKNLFASGMILLIISHGVIQFGLFEFFQAKHKTGISRLIEKGVPAHQQVIFRFEKNEFAKYCDTKWTEAEEFRYNDKMFDIIKAEVSGDSVFLLCVYDSDETELFSILDKIIDENSGNPVEENGVNNYLSQYYSCSSADYNFQIPQADNIYFSTYKNDLLKGEYLVQTPPPRT